MTVKVEFADLLVSLLHVQHVWGGEGLNLEF
jgi:hypothetical protein